MALPDELEISESGLNGAGLGVFARKHIKTGAMYGPFRGQTVHSNVNRKKTNTDYFWAVSCRFLLFLFHT